MDESSIRKYAGLMKELGLTGLEINESTGAVRLEMNPAAPALLQSAPALAAPQPAAPAEEGCLVVTSPMVGVFYAAPAEDAAPFVKVGDAVHRGDVLCIIEAMKLMNEIVSEYDGVVSEICVANNQVVDFGRPLFKLRKEGSL